MLLKLWSILNGAFSVNANTFYCLKWRSAWYFRTIRFFFFLWWHYNTLWVLAFSVIFYHSVLSLLSFLRPLIHIVWMSSSTSSIHLFLGLPPILLPIGFHSNILLSILPPSIRFTCPSQAILLHFINLTMFAFPMSSFSSWFFLILQIPFSSCTGPKIFLNICVCQLCALITYHLCKSLQGLWVWHILLCWS